MSYYLEENQRLYLKYERTDHGGLDGYKKALSEYKIIDLPFVEIPITTRCLRSCSKCSNLIPYLPEHKDYPLDELMIDMDTLSTHFDTIYRLKLHGGEPLMHRDLATIIEYALKLPNVFDIRISTSGMVLPDTNALRAMENKKFILHISSYKDVDAGPLINALESHGIRYYYMRGQRWSDLGDFRLRRERSVKETTRMISTCNGKRCTSLSEGRLFVCSFAAHRAKIISDSNTFSLNIRDIGFRSSSFPAFLDRMHFPECMYCNGIINGSAEVQAGL